MSETQDVQQTGRIETLRETARRAAQAEHVRQLPDGNPNGTTLDDVADVVARVTLQEFRQELQHLDERTYGVGNVPPFGPTRSIIKRLDALLASFDPPREQGQETPHIEHDLDCQSHFCGQCGFDIECECHCDQPRRQPCGCEHQIKLGQAWVTRVTSDDGPDVSVIGPPVPLIVPPEPLCVCGHRESMHNPDAEPHTCHGDDDTCLCEAFAAVPPEPQPEKEQP